MGQKPYVTYSNSASPNWPHISINRNGSVIYDPDEVLSSTHCWRIIRPSHLRPTEQIMSHSLPIEPAIYTIISAHRNLVVSLQDSNPRGHLVVEEPIESALNQQVRFPVLHPSTVCQRSCPPAVGRNKSPWWDLYLQISGQNVRGQGHPSPQETLRAEQRVQQFGQL